MVRVQGQHRIEPEVTPSALANVVDVGETLPAVSVSHGERHVVRIGIEMRAARPRAAVVLAVDAEGVQTCVAPREDGLQHGLKGG